MELLDAIHTTGTCRFFAPKPVPADVLARALDAARFAPTGGNRQPVRFIAVRDAALRQRLQELYLPHWETYFARVTRGEMRVGALPRVIANADHFARHLAEAPVLVVACARLADVHATDAALGRLSIVGGASVYPAVQNLLLAARAEGLGAALTTLLCAVEPEVKALLAIPDDISTAATIALGWPARPFPNKLNRRPLAEIAFLDRYGEALPGA
ncbi:MAG TPA: nitroreductase family protein [Myxococcota bacterium]|jgi:nitroreductase